MLFSGFSKFVLNCEEVWIFASAKPAVDASSVFVFASLTPPRVLRQAVSFSRSTYVASNSELATVSGPTGDQPDRSANVRSPFSRSVSAAGDARAGRHHDL